MFEVSLNEDSVLANLRTEAPWLRPAIRVIPSGKQTKPDDRESKLRVFDQATQRHLRRAVKSKATLPLDRDWTREDLYAETGLVEKGMTTAFSRSKGL